MSISVLSASVIVATLAFAHPAGAMSTEEAAESAVESYSELIVDQVIPQFHGGKWSAQCRDGYWLDRRVGTPMITVGQGLVVERQDLAISAGELKNRRTIVDGRIRGMVGEVANVWFGDKWVKMTIHCTSDPQFAWLG